MFLWGTGTQGLTYTELGPGGSASSLWHLTRPPAWLTPALTALHQLLFTRQSFPFRHHGTLTLGLKHQWKSLSSPAGWHRCQIPADFSHDQPFVCSVEHTATHFVYQSLSSPAGCHRLLEPGVTTTSPQTVLRPRSPQEPPHQPGLSASPSIC